MLAISRRRLRLAEQGERCGSRERESCVAGPGRAGWPAKEKRFVIPVSITEGLLIELHRRGGCPGRPVRLLIPYGWWSCGGPGHSPSAHGMSGYALWLYMFVAVKRG